MNKRFALILAVIFVLGLCFPMSAFADESASGNDLQQAGITPDNILGYNIDKLIEVIQEVLALSPEDKASLEQKFSEERLAEAKVMLEKKKDHLAEEALKEYAKKVEDALENADKASEDGADVTSTVSRMEEIKAEAEEILKIAIEVGNTDNATTRENITLENLSVEFDAQEIRLIFVKAMVAANKELNDARKSVKEAEKALKEVKKAGGNLTDVQAQLESAEANYNQLKELRDGFREIKHAISNEIEPDEKNKEDDEDKGENTGSLTEKAAKLKALYDKKIEKLEAKSNGKAVEKVREHFEQAMANIGAKLEQLPDEDKDKSDDKIQAGQDNQDEDKNDEDDKQVKDDKDNKSDKGSSNTVKGKNKK